MNTKLSEKALKVLENYLSLPIGNKTNTPYFNNRRAKVRFGLRALIGKGTPDDIANEARIIGLREKKKIQNLTPDDLKKFLVDHGLGIDCSGLVYHVLDAESRERGSGKLGRNIKVTGDIVRHVVSIIRPAENIGAATLSLEKNSYVVKTSEIKAGDFISILGAGLEHTYNHVIIITKVEDEGDSTIISYAHSYAYPSDGRYNHGAREGTINVLGNGDLAKANWHEGTYNGSGAGLLSILGEAKSVSVRRLHIFK